MSARFGRVTGAFIATDWISDPYISVIGVHFRARGPLQDPSPEVRDCSRFCNLPLEASASQDSLEQYGAPRTARAIVTAEHGPSQAENDFGQPDYSPETCLPDALPRLGSDHATGTSSRPPQRDAKRRPATFEVSQFSTHNHCWELTITAVLSSVKVMTGSTWTRCGSKPVPNNTSLFLDVKNEIQQFLEATLSSMGPAFRLGHCSRIKCKMSIVGTIY